MESKTKGEEMVKKREENERKEREETEKTRRIQIQIQIYFIVTGQCVFMNMLTMNGRNRHVNTPELAFR